MAAELVEFQMSLFLDCKRTIPIYIYKCYYKVADQANYCDTSTLEFEDLSFSHVSGTVSGSVAIALNCSAAAPCHDLTFEDAALTTSQNESARVTCDNAVNVVGVMCNSTLMR